MTVRRTDRERAVKSMCGNDQSAWPDGVRAYVDGGPVPPWSHSADREPGVLQDDLDVWASDFAAHREEEAARVVKWLIMRGSAISARFASRIRRSEHHENE